MAITDSFPVVEMGLVHTPPEVFPLDWAFLLRDGREVTLTRLEQHRTYGGLLSGTPLHPERDVAVALSQARDWDGGFHKKPLVIPAPIVKGLRESRLPELVQIPWAYLPAVTTFAIFQSNPRKNSGWSFASMLAIWWQSQFGIPTDGPLLDRLKSMPWSDHVEEWDP